MDIRIAQPIAGIAAVSRFSSLPKIQVRLSFRNLSHSTHLFFRGEIWSLGWRGWGSTCDQVLVAKPRKKKTKNKLLTSGWHLHDLYHHTFREIYFSLKHYKGLREFVLFDSKWQRGSNNGSYKRENSAECMKKILSIRTVQGWNGSVGHWLKFSEHSLGEVLSPLSLWGFKESITTCKRTGKVSPESSW